MATAEMTIGHLYAYKPNGGFEQQACWKSTNLPPKGLLDNQKELMEYGKMAKERSADLRKERNGAKRHMQQASSTTTASTSTLDLSGRDLEVSRL